MSYNQTRCAASDIQQEFFVSPLLPGLEIRSTYDSPASYSPHYHDAFSVGVILEGKTRFTCGRREYLADKGDIVLIEPRTAHQCNPCQDRPRSYHMLYVDRALFMRLAGLPDSAGQTLFARERLLRVPELSVQLAGIIEDIKQMKTGTEAALQELLMRLFREHCFTGTEESEAWNEPPGLKAARCELGSNFERAVKVSQAARRAGFSREGFIRAFRRVAGLSPGAYRHCARLEEGRRLLRLGLSIAETALATGYVDQSHFHRMFVKYFSATPRQYCRTRSLFSKNAP